MSNNFGEILRELRIKNGLTQKDVYSQLDVKQARFSSWETGNALPPSDMLLRLCEIYKVDDVLETFGFNGYDSNGDLKLTLPEIELIESFRLLDNRNKTIIKTLIEELILSSRMKKLIKQNKKKEHNNLFLAAASGTEGMDDEGLKLVDEDIKDLLKEGDDN